MHESEIIEIQGDDTFYFDCHDHVPCFNDCCRDLTQFLTPYDIIRLKQNLGLSSWEFLERFTQSHYGPKTGLPIVSLKPADPVYRVCPFVSPGGCMVYPDRPSSCRMYPAIRSVSYNNRTGERHVRYMLIRESHCKGFENQCARTITQWMDAQEMHLYHEHNDIMAELIRQKNTVMPGRLPHELERLFYMVCYDIDRLRKEILTQGRWDDFLKRQKPISRHADDVEIFKLGISLLMDFLKPPDSKFQTSLDRMYCK